MRAAITQFSLKGTYRDFRPSPKKYSSFRNYTAIPFSASIEITILPTAWLHHSFRSSMFALRDQVRMHNVQPRIQAYIVVSDEVLPFDRLPKTW